MDWIAFNEARALADFPSDLQPLHEAWVLANPGKSGRLAELADALAEEFRTAIQSNPANTLDPDGEKIPESCLRSAEALLFGTLALEMGLELSTERTQAMTRADLFLRQISYQHFLTGAGDGASPSPHYTVPGPSAGRALP